MTVGSGFINHVFPKEVIYHYDKNSMPHLKFVYEDF